MNENRPVRGVDAVPPEQELARREPAFPGLGVLVDPELFCGLVRLHARTEPGPCRLVDLRYRPGAECLATYVFGGGPAGIWVHARAVDSSAPSQRPPATVPRGGPPLTASGLGFGRLSWDQYGLLVRAFPYDDGLPALAALGDDAARTRLLAALLPGQPVERLTVRTVSYQPELRWTGCVEGPNGPVAALRIHSAAAFDSAQWNAQSLHPGEGLTLPRFLGRSRDHRAVAVEWAAGRPLEHVLFDEGLHRVEMEGVGAALAELHAQEAVQLPHFPPAGGAPAVRALTNRLAFILPRSAPRARRLGERLARRLVDMAPDEQPIHGNLKPDKVLLQGGGRVVLLDLDRACQGPLGRDPGTFIGHLERAAVAGRIPRERAEWAADAFLEGYDRTASWPLRRRDVRLHTALALFELSLDPFRTLMPEWPDRMMAILERAEDVLGH